MSEPGAPDTCQMPGLDSSPLSLLQGVYSRLHEQDIFVVGGAISPEQSSVTIRWGSEKPSLGKGSSVSLPVGQDDESAAAFQQLLLDCQPASFGRGGEDVFDDEYRKAAKMDVTSFCTDFNLSEHGIIDALTQALVPIVDDTRNGVKAELYKLNVYSGPSGRFKAHVDTPRSDAQMGSLVVCLPNPHKGGALAVRHAGRETVLDWSHDDKSIQWAAFFSDCEHEVLEVTQGHRVTLTYNLYWTSYGPSLMADQLSLLEKRAHPFYAALEALLKCPSFLPNGGQVGFWCAYQYPHTDDYAIPHLNRGLKGIDMVVYQALKCLTGSADLQAVLDASNYDEYLDDSTDKSDSDESSSKADGFIDKVYLSGHLGPIHLHDYEEENGLDPYEIEEHAWSKQKVVWLGPAPGRFDRLAAAYIAYGNQAMMEAYYSALVIISQVQPYEERAEDL